ncbi:hypothetical protein E4U54_007455 [Claviceps lovelessii]|nr:hypothetical protein E4U54_007455 [Claviceps lovelessii]
MAPNWSSLAIKIVLSLVVLITSLQFLGYLHTPPVRPRQRSRLATQIYASELLARTPTRTGGVIPKIFHQSWKSLDLPAKFQEWSLSCRQKHKDWEWVIWTDEDNLRLVQQHFPWLEEVYNALPGPIYRADLSRYLYMYIYGGVYADLDTECLLPTESLENTYGTLFEPATPPVADMALFGRMGTRPDFEHSIPNAWMAATPGHPLFLQSTQHVVDLHNESVAAGKSIGSAEGATGPISLRDAIVIYEENKVRGGLTLSETVQHLISVGPFAHDKVDNHQVLLLPSHFIYPYSWSYGGENARKECWVRDNGFDAEACKAKLKTKESGSICITYWSHTHSGPGHDQEAIDHIS